MQVNFHRQFDKDIEKYASPEQIQEIFAFVELLESATSLHDVQQIKKLVGFSGFYRFRLGEYRIGFSSKDSIVRLERFLHRKDIYKKYP